MTSRAELEHAVTADCAAESDTKQLRARILGQLARYLTFEGHLFALTDPVTRVATSPLADIPGLEWSLLPGLIGSRYRAPLNRWDTLVDSAVKARAMSQTSARERADNRGWSDLLDGLGVRDTLMLPLADRHGCWGFLELWSSSSTFSERDVALVAGLGPVITDGLRRNVARSFAQPRVKPDVVGPAVVVVGDDLRVREQTDAAARTLLELNPPDEPMAPVPAAVYNLGAAFLARRQASDETAGSQVWARVRVGGGSWLTARASSLGPDRIAITFEACTTDERSDLYARANELTSSESAVLGLLMVGLDNKQIAASRSVSEHTVHDQVRSILRKTGARSRQVLLAQALGTI